MTFDITRHCVSQDDADRLYVTFPELKRGDCPTCRGRGFYIHGLGEHECDCSMQLQLAKHYGVAGIGRPYQRLDWSDWRGDQGVVEPVTEYLLLHERMVDRGIGLLLHGPNGTGKTFVAMMVLKELVRRGYTCWSTTFSDTIESFTKTWGNPEEKQWFARKFMTSQVLLLDDLGREMRSSSNLAMSTFDSILRTRVSNGRPTLLTTNLGIKELGSGYGAGVLSLLKEASIQISFTGTDFRNDAHDRTLSEVRAGADRPIV